MELIAWQPDEMGWSQDELCISVSLSVDHWTTEQLLLSRDDAAAREEIPLPSSG